GWWNSAADHAAWTFHLDRPATFTVSMDYACADYAAGETYRIRVGASSLRGVVGSTGTWSNYRSLFLTELSLPAGDHRLEMRRDGPIRSALADVRAIILTPRAGAAPR